MCSPSCIAFASSSLSPDEIRGKRVIEVGSFDVNGSIRPWAESFGPASYTGVDIVAGPGVDQICDANRLVDRLGPQSFDLVISTEMLEHVRDWRRVVSNLKNLVAPGGSLLVTTRSAGFGYHGFPCDFWRFSVDDFNTIFHDMAVADVARIPTARASSSRRGGRWDSSSSRSKTSRSTPSSSPAAATTSATLKHGC